MVKPLTGLRDSRPEPEAQQARVAHGACIAHEAEGRDATERMDMDCDTVHRSAEGIVAAATNEADAWEAGAPGAHPQDAGIPDNFPEGLGVEGPQGTRKGAAQNEGG